MSITAAVLGGIGSYAVNAAKADGVAHGVLPQLGGEGAKRLARIAAAAQSDSLIDYTAPARVEPTMLFDTSLATVPYISDVIATMHSLYSAFYLMAISLDHEVGGVTARSKLDKFNPDRSLINAGRDFLTASKEDFAAGYTPALIASQYIGLPRAGDRTRNEIFGIVPSQEAAVTDITKTLTDVSNLAVGKAFEIELNSGANATKAQVRISISPMAATPENIRDILTVGTYDGSMRARWREIRAGRTKFWRDGIFALDRIDAYAQSAMKDKSGYLKEMQKRSGKSAAAFALTGEPSPSTASALMMIHADTLDKLYREDGIDLSVYKQRQSLFERTYAMIICVVDPEWESATFYYRNIEKATNVRASDMKRSTKGDGSDVMELMKVYMSGSAPGRL